MKNLISSFIKIAFRLCIRFSICADFFRELMAAHAVGEGSKAYAEKRYLDAFNILNEVAEYEIDDAYVGNAQYIVGVLYLHGLGVHKNVFCAEEYFYKAASRRNREAVKYISSKESK